MSSLQPPPAGSRHRAARAATHGRGAAFPGIAATAIAALVLATDALAAAAPSAELMQAAVVVLTYDALANECSSAGGPSAQLASERRTWESANRVDRVRVQLAELMSDPARRAQLDGASRSVVRAMHAQRLDPCAAAAALTRTRAAQFGAQVPELAAEAAVAAATDAGAVVAGTQSSTPAAATAGPPGAAAAGRPDPPGRPGRPAASGASAVPAATLAQVEGFAFDMRGGVGVGGLVTLDVYPVVLFRDGSLLTDVTGLAHPAGVEGSRREHPQDWTRWRRAGGELQRQGRDGWKKMAYQKVYSQLPAGLRLNGTYRRLGGSGTLGVGGTDLVAAWTEYAFAPDGRVVRSGGAGASSAFGSASTVSGSTAPQRSGRYRVDGLRLRIDYDDGTSEAPVLVMDPDDPKSALWLDGAGYSRRRE